MFPEPILTLRLSSDAFIDTVLTHDGIPAYSIESDRATTTICRCTHQGLSEVATVRWPQAYHPTIKGKGREMTTSVDMGGRNLSLKEVLRPASSLCPHSLCLSHTQKFYVAGHAHGFKWSRSQGLWQCKSHSHDLIAAIEPNNATSPMRLKIFPSPSLHPSNDQFSAQRLDIDAHSPLDSNLIDMLVLTALLLVTASDDWRKISTRVHSPRDSTSVPPSPVCLSSSSTDSTESYSLHSFDSDESSSSSPTSIDISLWDADSYASSYDPPPPYSLRSPDELVFRRPSSQRGAPRFHVINTD